MVEKFVARAPGKVILFGEHAVVHGVPAIAASIGLYTYVEVREVPFVELDFTDVGLQRHYTVDDIPQWDPVPHTVLDVKKVAQLGPLLRGLEGPARSTALAFLYLFGHLCRLPYRFSSKTELPIGAGLGSSAAFSVALAAAMIGAEASSPAEGVSKEKVNQWAFLAECCIHGTPSGIDNVVATYGGAVHFTKTPEGPTFVPLAMPAIDLALTNTKVPRSTSELVDRVHTLNKQHPLIAGPIFEAIRGVVAAAQEALNKHASDPEALRLTLGKLVSINHSLLAALGVSHPKLEEVRAGAERCQLGPTKLTGAGGGGCAITLVNPGASPRKLQVLLPGVKVFATTLGGEGFGVTIAPEAAEPSSLSYKVQYLAF